MFKSKSAVDLHSELREGGGGNILSTVTWVWDLVFYAYVVQRLDSAIHWINHSAGDKCS